MDNGEKLVVVALAIGGIYLLAKREQAGEGELAAGISMQIGYIPGEDIYEGGNVPVTTAVTNNSTRLGQPVAVNFNIDWKCEINGVLIWSNSGSGSFPPGSMQQFSHDISLPMGQWGSARVTCTVRGEDGTIAGTGSMQFTVLQAPIDYSAFVALS